jgi:hypothetical protein
MVMQPRPMAETSKPLEPSLRFCINGSPSDGSTYHRHYLLGAQLGSPDSVPRLLARSGKVPSRGTLPPFCKQSLQSMGRPSNCQPTQSAPTEWCADRI